MKKLLVVTLGTVAVLVLAGAAYAAVDYSKYTSFQQSQFFGSKDTYNQSQPMYFEGVKFTVSKVENKENTPKVTAADCNNNDFIAHYNPGYVSPFASLPAQELSKQSDRKDKCLNDVKNYEDRKTVIIHYWTTNIANQPRSIKNYIVTTGGSNDINGGDSPQSHVENLLSNQSVYNVFVLDVAKSNNGPLALLVTKNGHQKQITLELPKLMTTK